MVRAAVIAALLTMVAPAAALKIDIAHADIERALTIARSPAADRARFHAPYVQAVDTAFIERAEAITELRRVVLMAEEQTARGDRFFAYSVTRAHAALEVFRRRVSVRVQVRFHPLNTYVSVPAVTMALAGNDGALIGVRRDPVYGAAVKPGDAAPILGAVVEASFEAAALGQARREFLVRLDDQELGRVSFDFGAID